MPYIASTSPRISLDSTRERPRPIDDHMPLFLLVVSYFTLIENKSLITSLKPLPHSKNPSTNLQILWFIHNVKTTIIFYISSKNE